MRKCFVLAGNRVTGKVSIREFTDNGRGELDYEDALDQACTDVGWNDASWAIYHNADSETAFELDFEPLLDNLLVNDDVEVSKLDPDDPLWNE